ncbi:MAG: CYTH domain-containing protein, partial [Planctomycetaceae bacterium]
MLEIELKFRIESPSDVIARIEKLGAIGEKTVLQRDVYFRHPSRD